MKHSLEVCLVISLLAAGVPAIAAQTPAMRKGVSVELAATGHASPMPDADSENAFVVAVTANGSVYLGASPTTVSELAEKARSTPFQRGQKLYIKADARTQWGTVLQVLHATRSDGIAPQVLLTGQSEASAPGMIVPPKGLDVMVGAASPAGSVATVIQVLDSGRQPPLLTVNDDEVSWSALESTLQRQFEKGDDKVILLKADASLPYARVAHVIDVCRGAEAKVVLGGGSL